MSAPLATILVMFVLVAFVAFAWWYVYPRPKPVIDYTEEIPTWNFSYRSFFEPVEFDRRALSVEKQDVEWQKQMTAAGAAMHSARVKAVFFVHGTFVGNDPFSVIETIKVVYPNISKELATSIGSILRKPADIFVKDNGNFTQHYVKMFEQAIGGQIPCRLFHWSSGNNHLARLKAAASLAQTLADEIYRQRLGAEDRILLWGHSHAGQVFALLAQLLEYEQFGYRLLEVLQDAGEDILRLNSNLHTIRQMMLDFVTFGTPVLYTWPDSGYYRLLHIVNHRGTSHRGGSIKKGILTTKSGDYIQQLGILGTDLLASTPLERKLNKRLDEIFGPGRNLKAWRQFIRKRMRVSPHGKTFLVDYQDSSKVIPNFAKTFFGHGIYTRYETMLFNTRLVTEYYYKYRPS